MILMRIMTGFLFFLLAIAAATGCHLLLIFGPLRLENVRASTYFGVAGTLGVLAVLVLSFLCNFARCRSGHPGGIALALIVALCSPWLALVPTILLICFVGKECL